MIAGGKYTTYRIMAKDAVDAAVHELNQKVPASCTEDVPLLGADGYHALWNARPLLVDETGLRDLHIEHLLNRYGSLLPELLEMIKSSPRLPIRWTAHPSTSRSKPSTPRRMRVHYIWTISWLGVRGSPSRPGTAVWRPRRRSPASSLRSSGGGPPTWIVRSSITARESTPNGSHSTSQTISPPMPLASVLLTSGWAASTRSGQNSIKKVDDQRE